MSSSRRSRSALLVVLILILILGSPSPTRAQSFTIDDVLSPGFPLSLVSAKAADRIAWIEFERGMRNLYTAATPDFTPLRLTDYMDEDGHDLSKVQISDDGSVVVFIRGHTPNRDGWIANVTSDPRGTERAIWAVNTGGGDAWRVVEAWNVALSPDGKWVAYSKDGAIYRSAVNPGTHEAEAVDDAPPLYSTFGEGGPLNQQGVVEFAQQMNCKRDTLRKLQVVLETHLCLVAVNLIETLYGMVHIQSKPAEED